MPWANLGSGTLLCDRQARGSLLEELIHASSEEFVLKPCIKFNRLGLCGKIMKRTAYMAKWPLARVARNQWVQSRSSSTPRACFKAGAALLIEVFKRVCRPFQTSFWRKIQNIQPKTQYLDYTRGISVNSRSHRFIWVQCKLRSTSAIAKGNTAVKDYLSILSRFCERIL